MSLFCHFSFRYSQMANSSPAMEFVFVFSVLVYLICFRPLILSLPLFSSYFVFLNIDVTLSIYSELCGAADWLVFCRMEWEKWITVSGWQVQINSFGLNIHLLYKSVFSVRKKKRKAQHSTRWKVVICVFCLFFFLHGSRLLFVWDSLVF